MEKKSSRDNFSELLDLSNDQETIFSTLEIIQKNSKNWFYDHFCMGKTLKPITKF